MASALLSPPRYLLHRPTRGTVPYGHNIHNSLCRTDPWTKIFITRKNASNHGSYAAIASMVGRKAKKKEVVVPDPDYRIPVVLLGIAGGFAYQNNLLPAAPIGLLGLLLLIQEVKTGDQLQESGENVFVGGKNRWKYSTFINWELWWPQFPVLVYFKETQTKPEGQVHFFPVLFNGKQLYDVMLERAGPTVTSAPK